MTPLVPALLLAAAIVAAGLYIDRRDQMKIETEPSKVLPILAGTVLSLGITLAALFVMGV